MLDRLMDIPTCSARRIESSARIHVEIRAKHTGRPPVEAFAPVITEAEEEKEAG